MWPRPAERGAVTFGTTFSGQVTEQELADGTAKVHVCLHTENALSWVLDQGTGLPVFGNLAPDVLAGADAVLGQSLLKVTFINPAPGDPLPDLIQLLFERPQDVIDLSFVANAEDDSGTCMHTSQIGLFMTPFQGAVADGFPAEFIDIGPCEE